MENAHTKKNVVQLYTMPHLDAKYELNMGHYEIAAEKATNCYGSCTDDSCQSGETKAFPSADCGLPRCAPLGNYGGPDGGMDPYHIGDCKYLQEVAEKGGGACCPAQASAPAMLEQYGSLEAQVAAGQVSTL